MRVEADGRQLTISIHALREEGDANGMRRTRRHTNFYPRPPRGGRRHHQQALRLRRTDFYPRPPRGGRPDGSVVDNSVHDISIHALREEGDKLRSATLSSRSVFLSTPSARRATHTPSQLLPHFPISIHALREEGDQA